MSDVIQKKISEQKEGSKSARRAERKNKLELQLPEICGEINTTKIYNNGVKQYDDYESETPSIVLKKQILEVQKINEFKMNFKKIHGRDPTDYEIKNGIDTKVNMPINNNIINFDDGAGVFGGNNFVIPEMNLNNNENEQ